MPFRFDTNTVRGLLIDGEPWVIAADVAVILGYRMASDATRRLDDDEKGTHPVRTPGGEQMVSIVNEAGLYALVLGSQMSDAKRFRRWVTHEVLPEIRRTGSFGRQLAASGQYALPQTFSEALRELASTVEAKELAEQRAAELEPAARSWTVLAEAGGDYSLRDAAQILDRDPAISTGQNRLSRFLRELNWIDSSGQPYQAQVDAGRLTRRATGGYTDATTGGYVATWQVRITTKGLHKLHLMLDGSGPLLLSA